MNTDQQHGEATIFFGGEQARVGITPRGGHLRIEHRDPNGQWQSPYSLAPWMPGDYPQAPVLLQILRGDFFCFPFGVSEGIEDPHGETANRVWRIEEAGADSVRMRMDFETMPGRVTKRLAFDADARLLRQDHVIEGVDGVYNYGHHPTLQVPAGQTARLSTGPIRFGQVYPDGFASQADGETSALKDGSRFDSLDRVETAEGGISTLAEYPVRAACEDLVMFTADSGDWAWNACFLPGCLWLSFRKTADFPSSLYWMSNGGRSQEPWNGIHTGRIGIEDVCSHFHDGAHVSARDLLKAEGIATARRFVAGEAVTLSHWQCLVPTELPPCRIAKVEIGNRCIRIETAAGEDIEIESGLLAV